MSARPKVAVVGLDHWYFAYNIIDALVVSERQSSPSSLTAILLRAASRLRRRA